MRGAADTPGRSRIRGLALEIGGVCAAATGPGIMAQRQALFVLPGRVFAGDLPGLEIGRFRAPPEPPSESPSGSPSPSLAMALGFLAMAIQPEWPGPCVRYTQSEIVSVQNVSVRNVLYILDCCGSFLCYALLT